MSAKLADSECQIRLMQEKVNYVNLKISEAEEKGDLDPNDVYLETLEKHKMEMARLVKEKLAVEKLLHESGEEKRMVQEELFTSRMHHEAAIMEAQLLNEQLESSRGQLELSHCNSGQLQEKLNEVKVKLEEHTQLQELCLELKDKIAKLEEKIAAQKAECEELNKKLIAGNAHWQREYDLSTNETNNVRGKLFGLQNQYDIDCEEFPNYIDEFRKNAAYMRLMIKEQGIEDTGMVTDFMDKMEKALISMRAKYSQLEDKFTAASDEANRLKFLEEALREEKTAIINAFENYKQDHVSMNSDLNMKVEHQKLQLETINKTMDNLKVSNCIVCWCCDHGTNLLLLLLLI